MDSRLFIVVLCCVFSSIVCMPPRNGMIFYHPGYYDANHAMLFHLAPHPFYGRSASAGMSAFAAGDSIAAGTYLRENKANRDYASASQQSESYDNSGDVSAIAEAYPEEPAANEDTFVQRQEEEKNEILPQSDPAPPVEIQADPAPLAPLPQTKPSKVHVDLDTSAVNEESDEDEDEYVPRPPSKKQNRGNRGQEIPPASYFPNIFSDASGATIAVANAWSNGKVGARSSAIAYGSRKSNRRSYGKKHVADDE